MNHEIRKEILLFSLIIILTVATGIIIYNLNTPTTPSIPSLTPTMVNETNKTVIVAEETILPKKLTSFFKNNTENASATITATPPPELPPPLTRFEKTKLEHTSTQLVKNSECCQPCYYLKKT